MMFGFGFVVSVAQLSHVVPLAAQYGQSKCGEIEGRSSHGIPRCCRLPKLLVDDKLLWLDELLLLKPSDELLLLLKPSDELLLLL